MKVLDLQQTQDSLEERVRQYGQLRAESESQLAQLTQLRAELQSSAAGQRSVQQELAQKVSDVSGTEIYSSYRVAIYVAIKQPVALTLSAAIYPLPVCSRGFNSPTA